jgi:AcrR family transcriptional regulator
MSDSPARTPTQQAIWDAALRLFSESGYAATSVRDIGAAAGVDPSLVIRHFGSKEQLFLATMQLDLSANPLTSTPLETLGETFIDSVLTTDEHVRGVFLALLRASGSDGISSQLREAHEQSFVAPLRARMAGPDADLRARLAAALVGGLLYALWVAGDEALLATDHDEVVRRYGALLQSLITP